MKLYLRPIPTPLNMVNLWEHTPVDYYRFGEYPRILRPVGPRSGEFQVKVAPVDPPARGP